MNEYAINTISTRPLTSRPIPGGSETQCLSVPHHPQPSPPTHTHRVCLDDLSTVCQVVWVGRGPLGDTTVGLGPQAVSHDVGEKQIIRC